MFKSHAPRRFSALGLAMLVPVLGLALSANKSHAVLIEYAVQDLQDTTQGEDLWQYSYFVSDYAFGVNDGFSIYFDFDNTSQISHSLNNSDWLFSVSQPNAGFLLDGIFDAASLVSSPDLNLSFDVTFVLDSNAVVPASQAFEIFDIDGVVSSGLTTLSDSVVPVPSPLWLLMPGLLLMFRLQFVRGGRLAG